MENGGGLPISLALLLIAAIALSLYLCRIDYFSGSASGVLAHG